MKGFLLGLLIGVLAVPVSVAIYFKFGHPPVTTSDPPLPFEENIVMIPLHARMHREMVQTSPVTASPTNLEIGAHLYRQQCAVCHGLYGRPVAFAKGMFPDAPQLWEPHGNGVVGVSDDPPGETYWKIANGIRLSGMPAFNKVLNETEMWQISLLLANADKPLPASALNLLKQPMDLDPGGPQ